MRESYLIQKYKNFLLAQNLSTSTVDNYLTDAVAFLKWLTLYLEKKHYNLSPNYPTTYLPYIDEKTISSYKQSLIDKNTSTKTQTRRLFGIKKLLEFAASEGYLTQNAQNWISSEGILEEEKLLSGFRKWLDKHKATDVTIKNYISDIRHFIRYSYN